MSIKAENVLELTLLILLNMSSLSMDEITLSVYYTSEVSLLCLKTLLLRSLTLLTIQLKALLPMKT